MTKDEAKTVCVQPAQDLRSFPEAADGRPMPPMGDELMTAGLNCEDARFVAIQLAQNGLMLVAAAQPAQEAEVEMADAALTEWEDNNVLVPPHISGLALCAEYMRRTADFNRSWVDGRNGPRAGDYIGNSPGYIARRIQAAELFDRMAGAALDALRALPAAQPAQRVKALVWEDFDGRGAKANAMLLSSYLIVRWSTGQFEISVSAPGYSTFFDGDQFYPTLEAAKAAAQADFDRRILSQMKPAEQGGAEVELVTDADELRAELRRALAQIDSLEAECDRLHAQTEAAKNDVYRLAVAICGGEDFPGLLEAQPIEALVQEAKRQQSVHDETINVLLQAEAEVADLRHDLARLKASETDAINDVDRLMRLIRLAHPVMRECGWHLAPAYAAEGSDGCLEAACAEIEEEFGDMLRTEGGEAGQ